MLKIKIKNNVDLKELKKFGFWRDNYFTILNREIYDNDREYILILKNRRVVKGKLVCILDTNENIVNGYIIEEDNKIEKFIPDLIKAELIEEVKE